ncbi:MAG: hypothetical protein MR762_05465 [Clostridiales bacterium]|nr:hypothetical protein [Clostridiales bacterium]
MSFFIFISSHHKASIHEIWTSVFMGNIITEEISNCNRYFLRKKGNSPLDFMQKAQFQRRIPGTCRADGSRDRQKSEDRPGAEGKFFWPNFDTSLAFSRKADIMGS